MNLQNVPIKTLSTGCSACNALSQLRVLTLLQLFLAHHRARHSEGLQTVSVTSEPGEEEEVAASKSNSRWSWFLSGRTSHQPMRYKRFTSCSGSLEKWCEDANVIVTVCHWLCLIHPSCITCWLDLEHGTHEAGRGISSPSWPLLKLKSDVFAFVCVHAWVCKCVSVQRLPSKMCWRCFMWLLNVTLLRTWLATLDCLRISLKAKISEEYFRTFNRTLHYKQ